MSAQPIPRYTPEEYLSLERTSETKHEFYRGEMFAMAGASRTHVLLCSNLTYCIVGQLRGTDCEVYTNDMRVQVDPTGLYTYPDLVVTCAKPRFADDQSDTLLNPQVLIEVLSPATEGYDRGKKFEHYRQLASLQEYLLVAQDEPHVDRFLRRDDGRWLLDDSQGLEAVLTLESIEATLPLAEVYRRVDFEKKER